MKKRMLIAVIGCLILIIAGCSSNQKAYEEAIEQGLKYLDQAEYIKAEVFFEQALEFIENDERAKALLEQTKLIQRVEEHVQAGELDEAEALADQVIAINQGSDSVVQHAKKIKEDMSALRSLHDELVAKYDEARDLLNDEEYDDSLQILERLLDEGLSQPFFSEIKEDIDNLLKDVIKAKEAASLTAQQEAEKEAAKLKAAEEARQKEEEEKQKQQEEQKEEASQADKRDIGDFAGYWLTEDLACHITSDYIACAAPYSDFITYDEIWRVEHVNDTEVNVTLLDGAKTTFTLINDKSVLRTPDGYMYIRVTKDEANAIYDGYYELP